MKKLFLPLALILIVSISGCTIPGTDIEIPFLSGLFGTKVIEETSDVVAVKSLNVFPQKAAPNTEVRLVAYIENMDQYDTIPQEEDEKKVEGAILVDLYDYCEGMFYSSGENGMKVDCGDGKFNDINKEGADCTIEKLLPQEIKEIVWKLKVNKKEKVPLKTQCELKVYVQYPYKTTSLTTVYFIDYGEMQRQLEDGTFKQKDSLISLGEGPVKAYLTLLDQQPITITDNSGSSVLALQIENRGQGFPVKQPGDDDKKYDILGENIKLKLPKNGAKFTLDTDGKTCGFENKNDPKPEDDIRLIQDKSWKIVCPVKFEGMNVPKESSMHMTVDVEYEYEFRKSVVFKVEPKI